MQTVRGFKVPCIPVLLFSARLLIAGGILGPYASGHSFATALESAPPQTQQPQSEDQQSQDSQTTASQYDKAIFQKPIPSDKLVFLNNFAGSPSNVVIKDKQYSKLLHTVVPDCPFHYGHDMGLVDALETVLAGPTLPVQIRDGRYMMVAGSGGPNVAGRGFMWIDMQDGIALGGFYFHPSNGEPTPTLTIFSRQMKEKSLTMSQLPEAFAEDLNHWTRSAQIPPVEPRYFITGSNEKIALEHDEDYCAPAGGATPPPESVCQQMNLDAADADVNAAYYVKQTSHQPNATERMIYDDEQLAWIGVRDDTCRVGPDPLRCHIRMTHERTHVLTGHPGPSPGPHSPHR